MSDFDDLIYVICDKENIGTRKFRRLIDVFDCKEWRKAVTSNSCSHLYLVATTYTEFLLLPNAEVLSYRWCDIIKIKCPVLAPGAERPSEEIEAEISLDIFRKVKNLRNSLLWVDYLSHLNNPEHKKSVIRSMGSLYIKGSVYPLYMQDFTTMHPLNESFAIFPGHEFLSLFSNRKTAELSNEDLRIIAEQIKVKRNWGAIMVGLIIALLGLYFSYLAVVGTSRSNMFGLITSVITKLVFKISSLKTSLVDLVTSTLTEVFCIEVLFKASVTFVVIVSIIHILVPKSALKGVWESSEELTAGAIRVIRSFFSNLKKWDKEFSEEYRGGLFFYEEERVRRETLAKKLRIDLSRFETVTSALVLILPRDFSPETFARHLAVHFNVIPKLYPRCDKCNNRDEYDLHSFDECPCNPSDYHTMLSLVETAFFNITLSEKLPESMFSSAVRRGWIQQEVTYGRLQRTVVRDFVNACTQRKQYSILGTLIRRRPAAMRWLFDEYKRVGAMIQGTGIHENDEDYVVSNFDPLEVMDSNEDVFRELTNFLNRRERIFDQSDPIVDEPMNKTDDKFGIRFIINHRLVNKEEFCFDLIEKLCEHADFNPSDLFCSQSLLRALAESALTYEQDAYFAIVQCPVLLQGINPSENVQSEVIPTCFIKMLRCCWRTILTSGLRFSFSMRRESHFDWTLGLTELLPFIDRSVGRRKHKSVSQKYLVFNMNLSCESVTDNVSISESHVVLVYEFRSNQDDHKDFIHDSQRDNILRCESVFVTNSIEDRYLIDLLKRYSDVVNCDVELLADNGLRIHSFNSQIPGIVANDDDEDGEDEEEEVSISIFPARKRKIPMV